MLRLPTTWKSTLGFLWLFLALCIHVTYSLPMDSEWSDSRELTSARLGHSLNSDDIGQYADRQSEEQDGGYPMDEPMYRVRRVPLSLLMKRALSLFTQWRPMQAPETTRYVQSENDIVSAVGRSRPDGRPRGQPLRWG